MPFQYTDHNVKKQQKKALENDIFTYQFVANALY